MQVLDTLWNAQERLWWHSLLLWQNVRKMNQMLEKNDLNLNARYRGWGWHPSVQPFVSKRKCHLFKLGLTLKALNSHMLFRLLCFKQKEIISSSGMK